ncbi:hypothetical protein [Candidatus Nitrotoga sp. AM1P]|uniref:hypothetical protein n=1 Tax=Candidatus Nitrotoga sp. AM1P TaxID=2559597 RepID=UPI0015659C2E|nr:hypothetical protein [Candidatus Nitrotoga sp. AM1P]
MPLLPVKLVPVQANEVAAGLQFAIKVEIEPVVIEVGEAVSVHDGASVGVGAGPVSAQVTVRLPVASTLKPV